MAHELSLYHSSALHFHLTVDRIQRLTDSQKIILCVADVLFKGTTGKTSLGQVMPSGTCTFLVALPTPSKYFSYFDFHSFSRAAV